MVPGGGESGQASGLRPQVFQRVAPDADGEEQGAGLGQAAQGLALHAQVKLTASVLGRDQRLAGADGRGVRQEQVSRGDHAPIAPLDDGVRRQGVEDAGHTGEQPLAGTRDRAVQFGQRLAHRLLGGEEARRAQAGGGEGPSPIAPLHQAKVVVHQGGGAAERRGLIVGAVRRRAEMSLQHRQRLGLPRSGALGLAPAQLGAGGIGGRLARGRVAVGRQVGALEPRRLVNGRQADAEQVRLGVVIGRRLGGRRHRRHSSCPVRDKEFIGPMARAAPNFGHD